MRVYIYNSLLINISICIYVIVGFILIKARTCKDVYRNCRICVHLIEYENIIEVKRNRTFRIPKQELKHKTEPEDPSKTGRRPCGVSAISVWPQSKPHALLLSKITRVRQSPTPRPEWCRETCVCDGTAKLKL